jgi:tellurite resistance protein
MDAIKRAELEVEKYKGLVTRKDQVLKLMSNRDFEDFILKYFCVEECARYVCASVDSNLAEDERRDALAVAQSAAHLKRFLNITLRLGENAEEAIRTTEEELVELRREAMEKSNA